MTLIWHLYGRVTGLPQDHLSDRNLGYDVAAQAASSDTTKVRGSMSLRMLMMFKLQSRCLHLSPGADPVVYGKKEVRVKKRSSKSGKPNIVTVVSFIGSLVSVAGMECRSRLIKGPMINSAKKTA